MAIGGIRSMWIFTLFDLPVDTRSARTAYRQFHDFLLNDGFHMLQYSVYVRHCSSAEHAAVHDERIRVYLPPDGEVRVMSMTDLQFERMKIFVGQMRKPAEMAPEQLTFL
jgi:CRISPR-associated protein Cas2